MDKNKVYEMAKAESNNHTVYVWQKDSGEWDYGKELPNQYGELIATLVNGEEV